VLFGHCAFSTKNLYFNQNCLVALFPKIMCAVSESPRTEANIREAFSFYRNCGTELYFVHVAQEKKAFTKQLEKTIKRHSLVEDSIEIVALQGEVSQALLQFAQEKDIDLIIAGALAREGLIRYYMGSIARQLVRRSNCSVLLLTAPQKEWRPCKHIVVNGQAHPKTADTIKVALQLAQQFGSEHLSIVAELQKSINLRAADEVEASKLSAWKNEQERLEQERIQQVVNSSSTSSSIEIDSQVLFGKAGYCIGHFTQNSKADLLVLNSPDTKLGFIDRIFTHDLEFILSDLPSDVLIVHSTDSKPALP
jgi:nucleotide-binding universal stress UspA family protein